MSKYISIVTGATGGIGREFVRQLLNENIDQVWAVARNIENLNQLKEDFGEKIVLISGDLSQMNSLDLIAKKLHECNPSIRYLVNNAGSGRMGIYHEFSTSEI